MSTPEIDPHTHFPAAKGWAVSAGTNKYGDKVAYASRNDGHGRCVTFKLPLTGKFIGRGSAWVKGTKAYTKFDLLEQGESTYEETRAALIGVWKALQAQAGSPAPEPKQEQAPVWGPLPAAFPTKKARDAYLKGRLASDEGLATECLLYVFAHQTEEEQECEETVEDNGVGFSGCDADILSAFAKKALAFQPGGKFASPFSPKMRGILLKKMPKYRHQFTNALEAKGLCVIDEGAKEEAA